MALNISAWSIRRPIVSVVIFSVLSILGLVSFQTLPITRFPNIDLPIVSVTVTQSGAAPVELETQVTKKIEDAVAGVSLVKHINSNITDGTSSTLIEFRLEANTDRAVNDVKDAMSRIRADLPRTVDEPIVRRVEVEGAAILSYAVSASNKSVEEVSWFIDDVVMRKLQSVRGIASIDRTGGIDREIRVAIDPDQLNALGITAADVNRQLRATSTDVAGGRGEIAGREQAIRTLAGATKVEGLADTTIALPGSRRVRLSDLGSIADTAAEPRLFARLDTQPIVAFSIYRAKGESDARVADLVAEKVDELRGDNPDYSIRLIDSSVNYTVGNYQSAMDGLLEGAVLAVLVVFLFLRDWRATIISAIALPLSALPAFWAMSLMGFSLNLVSLLAITLATGVLVDDAIVEIENIVRHMRMGKSPYRAALEAADEIGLAVIAITITIVAVFVPVSFMGGIAGQYFKQFGLTVGVAVLFSLLVARLMTPLLAAYFLRNHDHPPAQDGFIMRFYTRMVRFSVRHRWLTLVLGLAIFSLSIYSMNFLPKGFIPAGDEARLLISVELPPGSRLADTAAVTDDITRRFKRRPEVSSVFVLGGQLLGNSGKEIRKAALIVNLLHKSKRAKTQMQIESDLEQDLAEIPDIRYWFVQGSGQRTLSLIVTGANSAKIAQVASQLQSEMRRVPLIANPVSTASLNRPEIQLRPRLERAAELGVTTEAISDTIRLATIGDVGTNLAKFNAGDRLIPIRVQLTDMARTNFDTLESLKVATAAGGAVPLSAVADISFAQGPTSIDRYDRTRRVAVEADLVGNTPLGAALDRIYDLPVMKTLPAGITITQAGDAEVQGEVFASFGEAMGAGLMMVYGVLVLLFASVLQPITILFSLPLSIGGVILALFVTNNAVSMPVVIGILMLVGIVTKNAIMLVDFAVEKMGRGASRLEAIVDAGRKRARPIVMTTIAMAAGMLPSALAFGDGGEFRAPMAIGVIGGLIVSTLLSLIFVPAVFTIMDSFGRAIWWMFGRFVGATDEPEPTALGVASATPDRPELIRQAAE
jgi:hydrophobe/amphiphile efflux-1 (HAE1) family protein